MAAAAHSPAFARRVGIPQKVATDFNQADTGTKLLSQAMSASPSEEFNEPQQRARSRALRAHG
jgi:hypothetical protein